MRTRTLLVAAFLLSACSADSAPSGTNQVANAEPSLDGGQTDTSTGGADASSNNNSNNARDPWEDVDTDGIPAQFDNCPDVANPEQEDADDDAVGDLCDNCPAVPNFAQGDEDADGVGDACEDEPAGEVCGMQENEFEAIKPNIYIVVDRSTSMRQLDGTAMTRIDRARAGLDIIAQTSASSVRLGLSVYPCANESAACDTLNQELIAMGDHAAADFQASYSTNYVDATCPHGSAPDTGSDGGLDAEEGGRHCTETGSAMLDVLNNNLVSDPADPLDAQRQKAVVLISDGAACGCSAQAEAVTAATDLAAQGVAVYAVGFNFSSAQLDAIAQAGGTDAGVAGAPYHYEADDAQTLATALNEIESLNIPCSFALEPPPQDPNRIWVSVDGANVLEDPADGFSYDAATNTLTLHGATCTALSSSDGEAELQIVSGCPDDGCVPVGESCQSDGECCNSACIDGVCADRCYPFNAPCRDNDDCCDGFCAKTAGETGTCQGG